jgi:hypothetical protein
MSERDAYVLEILIGQIPKGTNVNIVFGEALGVLGHAELFEPIRNLLHGGHQGRSWSSFWATARKNVPLTAMAVPSKKSAGPDAARR